jgi:hypothetical protein
MAKIKMTVAADLVAAAKSYNLANDYMGITNIYELINAYAGVSLVAERSKVANCDKNITEKNANIVKVSMNIDLWGMIVDDLGTNFNSINAQLLFPFFVEAAMLDMGRFNLVSKYTALADRGDVPQLNVGPSFDKNFFQVGAAGMTKGMFGDGVDGIAMSRNSATTFKANFNDVWTGVQFSFDAYDGANNVIEADFKATVSDGNLDLSHTSAAGSYNVGVWRLTEAIYKTAALNTWLKVDLNLANMVNVNNIIYMGYEA